MDELTERYVALWNEPDEAARAEGVRALWAEDGRQVLQAPAEWREQAAALGFPAATLSVRGHRDLETRVTRAYEMFVAGGAHRFRARGRGVRVGDAVKLEWDMVDAADAVVGGGTDVLLLDATDGSSPTTSSSTQCPVGSGLSGRLPRMAARDPAVCAAPAEPRRACGLRSP